MDKTGKKEEDDEAANGSGEPDDGPDGRVVASDDDADDEDDGVDGDDVEQVLVCPSYDEKEALAAQEVHDEGEDGDELEQDQGSADDGNGVVQVEVVQKVIFNARLWQRETDVEENSDEHVREDDETKSNESVTHIILLMPVVCDDCNDGIVNEKTKCQHST